MKNVALIVVLAFSMAIVSSCGSDTKAKSDETAQQGKEYTSAYVCPMHCDGSGSAEEGECPVCGMDYVVLNDHKSDGHHHND